MVVSDIKEQDARAMEAWRLRAVEGLSNKEIARRLGLTVRSDNVTKILARARELIPPEYEERKDTYFEEALAQMDWAIEKLSKRIEDSARPVLNYRQITEDITNSVIKPFLVERYFTKTGRPKPSVFAADWDAQSPELQAVENYIDPGRLDLAAVKEYRQVVESKRKLLGLDRNKHRLELSAAEGSSGEIAKDAINLLQEKAMRRVQIREIEIKGKDVDGGA